MDPDDDVCLCFHVSLRKLVAYMNRERPCRPSQLSDCLGAGTGCHWCVPFLEDLHRQWEAGDTPTLPLSPADYTKRRTSYRQSGSRAPDA